MQQPLVVVVGHALGRAVRLAVVEAHEAGGGGGFGNGVNREAVGGEPSGGFACGGFFVQHNLFFKKDFPAF